MFAKEFVGLNKTKAVRRAMDFWYKNFLNVLTLKEFFSKCTWRKGRGEIIITYRGSAPPLR